MGIAFFSSARMLAARQFENRQQSFRLNTLSSKPAASQTVTINDARSSRDGLT